MPVNFLKIVKYGASVVVYQVILLLVTLTSHIRVKVESPLSNQLPTNAPGRATEDGPNVWAPATHIGDLMKFQASSYRLSQPQPLQLFRK